MDSLIAVGTSAAMIYGIYTVIQMTMSSHDMAKEMAMNLYFESVGVIITLILLGKYLESVTKGKTSNPLRS